MFILAVGLFIPVFIEYMDTGLVPRQPTLIVSGFLVIAALLSVCAGLILGAMKRQSDQLFEIMSTDKSVLI